MARALPPGPSANFLPTWLNDYARDPLGFLTDCARTYGDVVRLPYGIMGDLIKWQRGASGYLINDPQDIKHVLVTNQRNYEKEGIVAAEKRIFGNGLLTSVDPIHRQQRRIVQPTLHHQHIEAWAEIIARKAREHVDQWRDGATVDIAQEMTQLTLGIIWNILFSADVGERANELLHGVTLGTHHIVDQYHTLFTIPDIVPIRKNRAFCHAMTQLDATIYGLIHERRASPNRPHDVLSSLIEARDEDGTAMSDTQLRDEVVTLILAGHETTANALSWAWYLLSQSPETEATLLDELHSALDGRPPSFENISQLRYTERIFSETLRLYPPAYIMHYRSALDDDTLPSGVPISRGTDIMISPYVLHHDARFFPDPKRFDPDRFLPSIKENRPQFSYFPFGGGARTCIGESLARMEGILVLSTIAQRVHMTLVPGQTIVPEPLVTLRPKPGILVAVSHRTS